MPLPLPLPLPMACASAAGRLDAGADPGWVPPMPDTASMRLFVDAPLHAGAAVDATPAQAHHLGPVMRRGPGDPVRLFNGRDGEWAARIEALRKGRAVLRVEGPLRPQASEPGPALVFAPLKRDATDLVAEKATELGATALYPVLTERTVAGRVSERVTA